MKTLILYGTKYGCTKSVAERLADLTGNAAAYNLKMGNYPSLAGFDCVIIGSPLYAGMIRKEVKTYVSRHLAELKTKRIGLFLCGFQEKNADVYFNNSFPAELSNAAYAKEFLGGAFDSKKAGLLDKLVQKAVTKSSGDYSKILEENITSFADRMKEVQV